AAACKATAACFCTEPIWVLVAAGNRLLVVASRFVIFSKISKPVSAADRFRSGKHGVYIFQGPVKKFFPWKISDFLGKYACIFSIFSNRRRFLRETAGNFGKYDVAGTVLCAAGGRA